MPCPVERLLEGVELCLQLGHAPELDLLLVAQLIDGGGIVEDQAPELIELGPR
jgi:hypothetical protein